MRASDKEKSANESDRVQTREMLSAFKERRSRMKVVRSKVTREQIAETVRDLRLWFIEFVAWIATYLPMPASVRRYMREEIHRARRDIRLTIALAMIAGMAVPVTQRWTSRPRGPVPGWRMQRRRMNIMKIYTRGIRLRTIADMRRVLENFAKVVARAKMRLPKRMKIAALVMARAPEMGMTPFGLAPATEAADTS
jgi:hypothetical protein